MAEQALLKHQLAKAEVAKLAEVLAQAEPQFDPIQFEQQVLAEIDQLELKQRVQHIIGVLQKQLPLDFELAAQVLLRFGKLWHQQATATWGSFTVWPIVDYVAEAGLNHPQLSLKLLKELTPLFSAEFAIRPFIEQHFEITYPELLNWAEDDNEHVRRLASEGIRPRLPWGKRLNDLCSDPKPIFPILDKLQDDPSLYVRKSVANNLNDISKDNPELVIQQCQQWWPEATEYRKWIIRHGLRSLIKAGWSEVFPLLGYTEQPNVLVNAFVVEQNKIQLGDDLRFSLSLLSQQDQNFVIDYKLFFVKANGQLSAKVYKWKNVSLSAGQTLELNKLHSFKLISTRRYYAGEHAIEVLFNGVPVVKQWFELVMT